MSLLWTILVGLVVGLLARFILPGKQSMGLILTTLLGIGGSLAAGYIGQAIGWYQAGQGAGFIGSLIGAIAILVIYGMIKGKAGAS